MTIESGFRLREFRVHPSEGLIEGPDGAVHVSPRSMAVLVHLAEHPREVITRDAFAKAIWHPAIVTDDALNSCIAELRRAVGDTASKPRFIKTIPKRGYQLVVPVERLENESVAVSSSGGSTQARPHWGRIYALLGVLVVVLMLAFIVFRPATQPVSQDPSIAVLPFQPIGNGMPTPIADGIHHDLLTRLSSLPGLKVISSTSVQRYQDTTLSIPEIARELGVTWIVEGSVQQAGEHIQINAQLIDAVDDHHLWAHTYRETYSAENFFAIQSQIIEDIARSLETVLGENERVEPTAPEDLEAYSRYVQGRSFLDTRTASGMQQALVYFREALERDYEYALAWVGVADALMLLYDYYDYAPPESVRPEVEKALNRALEIDPELAEAHASMGLYHMSLSNDGPLRAAGLDGPQAVRSLNRAVELRPGYAEAHNWLSWVLQLLGHADEALASANTAIELNPLAPETIHNVMSSNMAQGHYGRAIREARRFEELGIFDTSPQLYEAVALHHLGRFDAAVALLEDLEVTWAGAGAPAALAVSEIARGNSARAEALLGPIEATGDWFAVALVQAALGRHDEALTSLERISQWGQWPALVIHYFYPEVLAPLHADPRFDRILAAMYAYFGLPPDGRLPDPHRK